MFSRNNESQITGDNNLVFQDVNDSTITINLNDPQEVRTLLINFQEELKKLPISILDHIKESQNLEAPPTVGANLYFTLLAAIGETVMGGITRNAMFSLTVTNLTKEHRYFNQPYFQTNPKLPIPGSEGADSFIMINRENQPFPVRLEYGQPFTITFEIKPQALEFYRQIASEGAYIQAFITTTVGEIYSSNQYEIPKFLDQYASIVGRRR
ncbi:hypothetical protein GCM10027578_35610 [Spirosoma luteolum]